MDTLECRVAERRWSLGVDLSRETDIREAIFWVPEGTSGGAERPRMNRALSRQSISEEWPLCEFFKHFRISLSLTAER